MSLVHCLKAEGVINTYWWYVTMPLDTLKLWLFGKLMQVSVADHLMQLFARVGIPKEILSDQGTNFMSQLLRELYNLLNIRPIQTSPYHPQTDGLVERFN